MPKKPHRFDVRVLILALIAVAAGAFVLLRLGTANFNGSGSGVAVTPGAEIGGPFSLTDQDGKTRTDADFRGKLMLVYFGYTHCPDVCPLAITSMTAAVDSLGGKAGEVVPIFITVDPARDTPARLKQYAARFGNRLVALTGTPDQIAVAAKAYHVYYTKQPAASENGGPETLDHSSAIYLMGRDGKYLAHFNVQSTAKQMAAKISGLL